MWELLTSKKEKASQFTGHEGSIISRIIALERKTKIEVEHVQVKIKTGDDDATMNEGLTMVLECDKKAKVERIFFLREKQVILDCMLEMWHHNVEKRRWKNQFLK